MSKELETLTKIKGLNDEEKRYIVRRISEIKNRKIGAVNAKYQRRPTPMSQAEQLTKLREGKYKILDKPSMYYYGGILDYIVFEGQEDLSSWDARKKAETAAITKRADQLTDKVMFFEGSDQVVDLLSEFENEVITVLDVEIDNAQAAISAYNDDGMFDEDFYD